MFRNYTKATVLLTLFRAVVFLTPVLVVAQTVPERSSISRTAKAEPRFRTELINGRRAAEREVLFQFRDTFLARANPQQVTSTIAELRQGHDAGDFEMLTDSGVLRIRSRSKSTAALIREISRHPDILYAEPNYVVRATAAPPNDDKFDNLWGLHNTGQTIVAPGIAGADIDALKAWQMTTGSINNVIAVHDTGVDYNHPDLAANMWRAPAAFSVTIAGRTITCAAGTRGYNAITNTCDPMDDHDHGTHVAGTIGAVGNNRIGVIGVSPITRIMALKFLDDLGFGTVSDAIKAIDFAIQVKARFAATRGANIRVMNASWGGDAFSQAMLDSLRRAHQADILFVTSAGNDWDNIDFRPQYPASYKEPNVLTVAATDNNDLLFLWSNFGPKSVHIAAPGDYVMSTIRNGEYRFSSGTSMAAPHVSGAAALVLSSCPINTAAVKDVLIATGDKLPALNGVTMTGARLNVARAVSTCTAPYFTLNPTPQEVTIRPGRTGTYVITITPFKSYKGSVMMSVTGLPAGVTGTFQPAVVNMAAVPQTTTLTLNVPVNVLPGSHQFTIRGVAANQDRSASAFVRVPGYTVKDLGTLPAPAGLGETHALSVNNTRQVAGYSKTGEFYPGAHAFLYSAGTLQDLGTLGGPISIARGIGNAGHVVGEAMQSSGYTKAFLWSNGRMQDLGTLPGHFQSAAFDVNDSGHVVGYSGTNTEERAFLRTTGGLKDLGTLGTFGSRALAINNLGHVVGYSQAGPFMDHAFLYSNGTMKDLGTIGGVAIGISQAADINDKGQIVGHSTVGQDLLTMHACLWENGKAKDLGTLSLYPYSYGKSINDAGHVVGFVAPTQQTDVKEVQRAFLYRDGRMLDLNEAIPVKSGWVLFEASSINDNGVIVGLGKRNNELRAFMLTPIR
jgi:probable HAF family extracellular repeat protein